MHFHLLTENYRQPTKIENLTDYYNLGQNKMEQQTPISPKSRMKPRKGHKRADKIIEF